MVTGAGGWRAGMEFLHHKKYSGIPVFMQKKISRKSGYWLPV